MWEFTIYPLHPSHPLEPATAETWRTVFSTEGAAPIMCLAVRVLPDGNIGGGHSASCCRGSSSGGDSAGDVVGGAAADIDGDGEGGNCEEIILGDISGCASLLRVAACGGSAAAARLVSCSTWVPHGKWCGT